MKRLDWLYVLANVLLWALVAVAGWGFLNPHTTLVSY